MGAEDTSDWRGDFPPGRSDTVASPLVPANQGLGAVVIGAGPYGLAAATHLAERGVEHRVVRHPDGRVARAHADRDVPQVDRQGLKHRLAA